MKIAKQTKNKDRTVLAIHGGPKVRNKPFPRWPDYQDEEIAAAVEVLRSGHFARQSGSKVHEFEEAYARKFGVRHALAVSSGTAAIHVALGALGIGPGDEVINTAHCFIGTATPVVHAAAVPVFADIDPRTFNIDPVSIEEHISPYTKAVIPVHLNGLPAEMDAILDIARRRGLVVVEDAAQAHGARYKGRLAGTMGVIGCFSFWEDKIITTNGEGGMVITDDDELAQAARKFHHHGEMRQDGGYYQGERLYFHETLGYNYRMTEVQGAVGLVQLGRLDEYVRRRRENAHLLTRLLSTVPGILPPYEPPGCEHAFYKYILRLDRAYLKVSAKEFVEALSAEGIPCSRRYPTPLHQQPLFTQYNGFGRTHAPFAPPYHPRAVHYGDGLLNAERLPEDLVRLSMSPTLAEEDIQDMAQAVRKVAEAFCVR
jgi:perosamine synthetase